ncbi:hypothetical protein QO010_002899 [Caulobacter ginsengisoli]|uniref:Uncharacterized protein n=1 Tax=Caulobacter ginsengisoli TaxID=400775 RepID=A0ABU0ISZ0_9CAUL|nr:hypothetical protein [Caulobacter ginsengisoli]MDQ0465115.1 hypothetical protein [Caulobacter ginsengisoli]
MIIPLLVFLFAASQPPEPHPERYPRCQPGERPFAGLEWSIEQVMAQDRVVIGRVRSVGKADSENSEFAGDGRGFFVIQPTLYLRGPPLKGRQTGQYRWSWNDTGEYLNNTPAVGDLRLYMAVGGRGGWRDIEAILCLPRPPEGVAG